MAQVIGIFKGRDLIQKGGTVKFFKDDMAWHNEELETEKLLQEFF